jgi:protein arginine N-methyltransferase 5
MSPLNSINIAIVGSGKGALVDVTYKAMEELSIESKCHVTTIEKNQSACIFLQSRNAKNWHSSVEILNIDMRDWAPRESYNLIISELLGSFGCNELSPECLKPLEKFLDRSHGTFIPQSYTSHIAPVFTPHIYKTLKDRMDARDFEKQYVVKLSESSLCSTKINDIWSFEHPSPHQKLKKNIISTFKIRYKTVIHGIAGFFTTKLYNDIELSIIPDSHTPDLISWFPFFFPLESPLYVTDDTELEISLSRESKNGKVWYTWGLETFMYLVGPGSDSNELQVRVRTGVTKIHNHNGYAFHMDENQEA